MALVLRAGQFDKVLGNRDVHKSLIAAEYCGVKVEHVNSSEQVKSSVLETPDGSIFESKSMARYIAKLKGANTLYGSSVYEYARVEEWMEFVDMEIDEKLKRWIHPWMGLGALNNNFSGAAIYSVRQSLRVLNTHLATGTYYLVGEGITLADIIMACGLHFGFTRIMTKSFTSEFSHVERYFWNLVNQPNFKKILGEVKQAESLPAGSAEVVKEMLEEEKEWRSEDSLEE